MRKQLIVQCTTIMSYLHMCQTLLEQTKNRETVSVLNPNAYILYIATCICCDSAVVRVWLGLGAKNT